MDDFDFDASIWASSSSKSPVAEPSVPSLSSPSKSAAKFQHDALDDDNFEFGTPLQASSTVEEDDFGDFGDFEDVPERQLSDSFARPSTQNDENAFPSSYSYSADWEALHLHPFPSSSSLKSQIYETLKPFWVAVDASDFLTEENIRQVGGLNQILVTSDSRSLYQTLYQSPPPNIQPPNWTRSRIRRRHLVSLGIPVNLDEVLPYVNGKPMPALSISTRPMSAPPGSHILSRVTSPPPASSGIARPGSRPGSKPPSRSGTPKPSPLARASTFAQLGLGQPPEVDEVAVEEILALSPETFTLLPLSTLEAQLARVRSLTAQTSSLLAYLLQQKDALEQDSETYNKLIAELIVEAQKAKSGPKTRNGGTRRASGMT